MNSYYFHSLIYLQELGDAAYSIGMTSTAPTLLAPPHDSDDVRGFAAAVDPLTFGTLDICATSARSRWVLNASVSGCVSLWK
jgi:hypothetical protein